MGAYSHWHDDVPISRDHYAEDDYGLNGYSDADARRDDLRDTIVNAEDREERDKPVKKATRRGGDMTSTQQVKCGHCDGKGRIRDEYKNRTTNCPTCGGSGLV